MGENAGRDQRVAAVLADIGVFSRAVWPHTALRAYQLPAARAIVAAVRAGRGESLCVVMARQSGKDELLAQVTGFLLIHAQFRGGEIVVATPSLSTQGEIGMARLEARLEEAGSSRRAARGTGTRSRWARPACAFSRRGRRRMCGARRRAC